MSDDYPNDGEEHDGCGGVWVCLYVQDHEEHYECNKCGAKRCYD